MVIRSTDSVADVAAIFFPLDTSFGRLISIGLCVFGPYGSPDRLKSCVTNVKNSFFFLEIFPDCIWT